jgi:hypothetical protein
MMGTARRHPLVRRSPANDTEVPGLVKTGRVLGIDLVSLLLDGFESLASGPVSRAFAGRPAAQA